MQNLVKKVDTWYIKDSLTNKEYQVNKDVITIKFKEELKNRNNNFEILKTSFPGTNFLRESKTRFIDIQIPKGMDVVEFSEKLRELISIEIVELNSYGEYHWLPNDAQRSQQWALSKIKMYDAWDKVIGC